MKIAIVSDSHGSLDRLKILLENLKIGNIKYLLHAGDGIVEGLEKIFADYPEIKIFYAQGNCDVNPEVMTKVNNLENCELKEVIFCEIEGVKFGISHIQGIAERVLSDKKIDIFLHGHTHRAKQEKIAKKLILNPGALTEDGRYFLLDLNNFKVERKFFNEKII